MKRALGASKRKGAGSLKHIHTDSNTKITYSVVNVINVVLAGK